MLWGLIIGMKSLEKFKKSLSNSRNSLCLLRGVVVLVGGIVAIGMVVDGSLISVFHVTDLSPTSLCGDTAVVHR